MIKNVIKAFQIQFYLFSWKGELFQKLLIIITAFRCWLKIFLFLPLLRSPFSFLVMPVLSGIGKYLLPFPLCLCPPFSPEAFIPVIMPVKNKPCIQLFITFMKLFFLQHLVDLLCTAFFPAKAIDETIPGQILRKCQFCNLLSFNHQLHCNITCQIPQIRFFLFFRENMQIQTMEQHVQISSHYSCRILPIAFEKISTFCNKIFPICGNLLFFLRAAVSHTGKRPVQIRKVMI